MEASKILQSDMLDILFENRNQQYGAYELRRNASRRTMKALTIALASVAIVITASSFGQGQSEMDKPEERIVVTTITPVEEKPVVPPPEKPAPKPAAPAPRTEKYVTVDIVPNEDVVEPLPTITDLDQSQIGTEKRDGPVDIGLNIPTTMTDGLGKGIIDEKVEKPEIASVVDVKAKFLGDWVRFLTSNLDANVGVENGAPAGQYKVTIEFVIDVDGSMSMIRALTNHGYGMEEEAVRVIRKSNKWSPAMQRSFAVKAYHRQVITFEINGD